MIKSLQAGRSKPLNLLFCVSSFYEDYAKEMLRNGLEFLFSEAMASKKTMEFSIVESKDGEITIFTGNAKKMLPNDPNSIKILPFLEVSGVVTDIIFARKFARFVLRDLQNTDILGFSVIKVLGSLEIAQMVRFFLEENKNLDGVITMGVVIKGETDHYEHVSAQAIRGIGDLASYAKPVITTGIITAREVQHVKERISKAGKNLGAAWVKACLECIYVKRQIELS